MKNKLLIAFFAITTLILSCDEDDNNLNGTGVVNLTYEELTEVENATIGLTINLDIDSYSHNGGTIEVTISGADYGTDYTTSTGSSTFSLEVEPRSLLSTFSIMPVDNDILDGTKTLTITLSGVTGSLELGENTQMIFRIIDNEQPIVSVLDFESNVMSVNENDASSTPINITFDLPTTDGGTLSIVSSGDAVYGADYTIDGQTSGDFDISVPAGANSASFNIQPIDNSIFEADKAAIFTLAAVDGGLTFGAVLETTITIVNDDLPPNPIIDFNTSNPVSINEAAGTVTLNFDLSSATTSDATIELTASGMAIAGQDFTLNGDSSNPFMFTVPSGSTSASVDLMITDDSDFEGDETLTLDITNAAGGLDLGVTLQYSTTIIDDDPDPSIFNYLETFEGFDGTDTYLNSVLGYQNALVTQTLPAIEIMKIITNAGSFSDPDNIAGTSDNGINIFYNTGGDPTAEGILDNVLITPVMQGSGSMDVSIDVAYAFKNQNNAEVTFYWSETYDGSGTFNEADWTAIDIETAADMDGEGFGNNIYKREQYTINPSTDFYLAIRVNQNIDTTNYRTRWRFDNIRVDSQ